MLEVKFETDNAAFDGRGRNIEVARILRGLAKKVESGEDSGKVMDFNGNSVGTWRLID